MSSNPVEKPFWDVPQNTPADIVCVVCLKTLTGGLDTYGPIRFERCQTDFLNDTVPPQAENYYLDLKVQGQDIIKEFGRVRSERQLEKREENLESIREEMNNLLEAYPPLYHRGIPDWLYTDEKIKK